MSANTMALIISRKKMTRNLAAELLLMTIDQMLTYSLALGSKLSMEGVSVTSVKRDRSEMTVTSLISNTDSYLTFFSAISNFAPISALSLFFLGMMRLAPVIAWAPFFGSKTPPPVKMGLLIALTVILLPHMAMTSKTLIGDPLVLDVDGCCDLVDGGLSAPSR